jgi:DNA-binding PadR family transcriptional regulator
MSGTPTTQASSREMTSVIYWVLLGLVIKRPSYGLELYHRYQRLYGDVLPMSGESRVYGALDSLERRKLIERMPGSEVARQPKPHYKATQLGVSSYEEWLVAQVGEERHRQELWVRQLDIFAGDPAAMLDLIGRFEKQYLKGIAEVASLPAAPSNPRAELIEDLVAERHRLASGEMLAWLHYAEDRIETRAGRSYVDDPPGT